LKHNGFQALLISKIHPKVEELKTTLFEISSLKNGIIYNYEKFLFNDWG